MYSFYSTQLDSFSITRTFISLKQSFSIRKTLFKTVTTNPAPLHDLIFPNLEMPLPPFRTFSHSLGCLAQAYLLQLAQGHDLGSVGQHIFLCWHSPLLDRCKHAPGYFCDTWELSQRTCACISCHWIGLLNLFQVNFLEQVPGMSIKVPHFFNLLVYFPKSQSLIFKSFF